MIRRCIVLTAAFAVSTAVLLAQAPTATPAAKAPVTSATKPAAAKAWTPARTPDGDPDISGRYDSRTATPTERPKALGSKEFYTDEEFKEVTEKLHNGDPTAPGVRGGGGGEGGAPPPPAAEGAAAPAGGGGRGNRVDVQYAHDLYGYNVSDSNYVATKRTSLVVGPEGTIPPMLPEARQRNAARAAANKGHEFDSVKNLNLETRCILSAREMIPLFPIEDSNTNLQIVQGKGWVAIYEELNHSNRVIPTDGRPHIAQNIRQLQGDSVGHWEGNTLVVDTTNFTDQTAFRGSSENLHLVERFIPAADGMLLYRFTVEDPHTWDKPWTMEVPWMKTTGALFEYDCTEGNEAAGLILGGARAKEAADAAKAGK